MKKTVYIHIGSHKTGTTALQQFLSHNRQILKENSYLYPGNTENHHDMAKEFQVLTLQEISTNAKTATNKYFDEFNNSNLEKIILSAEKFEILGPHINKLKEFLAPKFQVKIIFYVRRQDEKLESFYNEYVKNPTRRYNKSIFEFIETKIGSGLTDSLNQMETGKKSNESDYYSVLSQWSESFGKENILVRVYEHEQLPKGIYQDFLSIIGLRLDENYKIPKTRMNESLSWDLIEVIRICNTSFRDDKKIHQFLLKNLTLINSEFKEKKQHLLSPQQRRDIISLFEESNTKIAREYLDRSDGRLFYAPLPDLDEPWKPYEGLTVEKIVPIFTQMLFNLDRQIKMRKDRSLKGKIMMIIKKIGSRFGLLPSMEYWYNRFHRY